MSSTTPVGLPPRVGPANPLLKFLDRLFLWLPNDHAPGFPAVCLFLLRQFTLAPILMVGPLVVGMLVSPRANLVGDVGKTPGWVMAAFIAVCMALVQELGRYSFVRHAERPLRSLAVFTAVTLTIVLLMYHDRLYTVTWAAMAQLAASAAIFYGLQYRKYIAALIAAIIIGHTAVYAIAPQFFRPAAQAASDRPVSSSPNAPDVGDMQSWAKLYPGAVITESKSETFLGLISWKVTYRVQASPDQIETFYETIANQRGFTDTQSLAGLHMFRQESTHDDFSYALTSDATGSQVMFQARTFGKAGPSD
jgi:hypothetical protein